MQLMWLLSSAGGFGSPETGPLVSGPASPLIALWPQGHLPTHGQRGVADRVGDAGACECTWPPAVHIWVCCTVSRMMSVFVYVYVCLYVCARSDSGFVCATCGSTAGCGRAACSASKRQDASHVGISSTL
jgi:hypothetical protein